MTDEEREADVRRTTEFLQKLSDNTRAERERDPIAWEFRALSNVYQRAIERQTAAWERAMNAIEHAANAWEAKANDS